MKVFRIVLPLCLVATALAAGDVEASTGTVTAQFMGASGGMKLMASDDLYMMVQQEKLAEKRPSGSKGNGCAGCTSINVAGQNSWTDLVETQSEDGGAGSVFSTTFSVDENGVSFQLMSHLGKGLESTVEEIVPCSGNSTGTNCTETVTVQKDELKFSFVVSGFTFSSPDNKFVYGIVLKDKSGGKGNLTDEEETAGKAERSKKVEMADALLVMPTTGLLKGGDEDVEVNATITMETQGSKTIINFQFDSWAEGLSLYYDPSMVLNDSPDPDPKYSGATSKMVSAGLLTTVALVLAVFM